MHNGSGGGGNLVDEIRLVDGVLINVLVVLNLLSLILVVLRLIGGVFVMNRLISRVLVMDGDFSGVLVSDGSLSGVLVLDILVSIGLMRNKLFMLGVHRGVGNVSNILVVKRLNIFINVSWVNMGCFVMRCSLRLVVDSMVNWDNCDMRCNNGGLMNDSWI